MYDYYNTTLNMSVNMKITVDDLIVTPFSKRPLEEQVRIFTEGRPTPPLKMQAVIVIENVSNSSAHLNQNTDTECCFREVDYSAQSAYDTHQWLTASALTGSYYCWPCLLFQRPGLWNKTGVSDVVFLTEGAPEHERSSEHIEAMFRYQNFIDQNLKIKKEQTVVKNAEALKRLADTVCTLAAMQRPPCESDNSCTSLDVEKCLTAMRLLRRYDCLNKNHSDDAIKLMLEFPEIINSMTCAEAKVMKLRIAEEISSAMYISVILSLHSNVELKAQISTVLRYVCNGNVCERFVGFSHIFSNASVSSVYKHIMSVINEFKISTKCIAVSLDGAILPSDEIGYLLNRLKTEVPKCVCVPWYYHLMDDIIEKSLYTHPKCEQFFKAMASLEDYLSENPEVLRSFYDFTPENRPRDIPIMLRCPGNWFVASDFLKYVLEYRHLLSKFFNNIIENSTEWSADVLTKAFGFREFLQEWLTVFFLILFSEIFNLTSALNEALSKELPDRLDAGIVLKVINDLNRMCSSEFTILWTRVEKEFGEKARDVKGYKYIKLFEDIVKQVAEEVEFRYSVLDKLQFCDMFDFKCKKWFEKYPERFRKLEEFYAMDLNLTLFQNEMEVLQKRSAFSVKSVQEFHQYLFQSNFKHSLKTLFDISELILAMPFKRASIESELSPLNKIGKWSFGPNYVPSASDFSIVFVESDYLQEIKQSSTFYEEVLANFPHASFSLTELLVV